MLTMTLLMIMRVPMNPSTTTKRMTTPKTTETNRLTKLNPQIMKGVTTYPHLKYATVLSSRSCLLRLPFALFPFLPAIPSSQSQTLEGLFGLTQRPSRALDSPHALLPELQRYKDTFRCAALSVEVPGHRPKQASQTLIVRLLKTHFFIPIFDCEKSTE